ncbi:MAG: sensor histidine kinase [Bacteroidales bacterium]|nr:sensor histidine kinase [Bacteroidales bacterium]
MKNYSASKLSLIIAVIISVTVGLSMTVACFMESVSSWMATVGVFMIGVGILSFFILKRVFDNYVRAQVKPIYGTLESFSKADAEQLKLKTDDSGSQDVNGIIEQVNDDVAKWAKDRTQEIAMLKRNEKYRKEYIGNVSHELKTPLFNIQGYISTLIDGGSEDPEICIKYLERTDKNINRLISIVNDLETISKFETGNLKLNYEVFDLAAVVNDIMELYEIKAEKKRITLKTDFKPTPPIYVNADKTRIFEVISNLVVNSINYGREDGSTTVGIYDIDNKWLVEVQDTGIGIDEENIKRIFERFFRVDKSRSSQSGGTGLGLAIVKHILEAHGERIMVKSKINEGTTFSFTLEKAAVTD